MRLLITTAVLAAALLTPTLRAQGRPDPTAQKTAMEKFKFLVGTWTGDATISPGEGPQLTIRQTEEVMYKLDGVVLLIEGTGRDDSGKVVFNALAIVSYDPNSGTYRIRAWNAGNFVETEIKTSGKGFDWGFDRGPVSMTNHMTVDEQGRWSETSEVVLKDGRKVHGVRMLLSRK
jgi:hypothetical protein